ncbi:MAG: hypothetical protein M0018_09950 [Nitrospiraceae bacterium]|nr:hypothetical protein [Nitrospiraceae bacterium]
MAEGEQLTEKRDSKRDLVTVPISYNYSIQEQGETRNFTMSGISLNLSDAGICFYTHVRLEDGTALNVYGRALWDGARKGTVKWCRKITEGLFRVGVQLI